MRRNPLQHHSIAERPLRFLLWSLALSLPFYLWGRYWPIDGLPLDLPVSAAMIIVPATIATAFTWREGGSASARELWWRVGDVGRLSSRWWVVVSLAWMPVASMLMYITMRTTGLPLPTAPVVPLVSAPFVFVVFFLGSVFEELGWTAYATDPLQQRMGVLRTGLVIGAVWAAWHVVPWLTQGRSVAWVMGQASATVVMRLTMGWIHENGGRSLFLAIVFHAMINTSYALFPNGGSHYDPRILTLVLTVMHVGAVRIVWPGHTAPRWL